MLAEVCTLLAASGLQVLAGFIVFTMAGQRNAAPPSAGLALLVVLGLLGACDGITITSPKDYAQRACGIWTDALLEEDATRESVRSAAATGRDLAARAAEDDSDYLALSGAMDMLVRSYDDEDIDLYLLTAEVALDECHEILEVEEHLRREIERLR